MHPGEVITVDELATDTGIGAESAELVLDALVRADLFERREPQQFIRVSLFDRSEMQRAADPQLRRYQG
jgi:hypothetical protein